MDYEQLDGSSGNRPVAKRHGWHISRVSWLVACGNKQILKILRGTGQNAALWAGGEGVEYFSAGTQSCDQNLRRGVWRSAFSEGRAKCESEPIWKRADDGGRGNSRCVSADGGACGGIPGWRRE